MSDYKEKKPFIENREGNIGMRDVTQDSHDTITNHNIHHSNTVVYNGEAAREKRLEEKVEEYRHFCKQNISSRFIDRELKLTLKEKADALGLDEATADKIEEGVIAALSTDSLSRQDIVTLDLAEEGIKSNEVEPVMNRIVALADSNESPKVQYLANLILAVEDPRKCILRYEKAKFDSYWQMYWVYLAYLRQKNPDKAEKVKNKLNDNLSMPEDLLLLLNGAGCLIDYFANNGGESYKNTALKYLTHFRGNEPLVIGFVDALKALLKASRPLYFTGNPSLDFYFKLFGAQQKKAISSPFAAESHPSFSEKPAPTVTTTPRDVYEIAREAANNSVKTPKPQQQVYQPTTPSAQPSSTSGPTEKTNWKKIVGYLAAAGLCVLVFVKMCTGSPHKEENKTAQIEQQEIIPVETPQENTPVSKPASSVKKSSAKAETSAPKEAVTKPSEEISRTSTTTSTPVPEPAETPKAVEKTPQPAEMSESQLLAEGKSLVKKFKPEQAVEYFSQAATKGSVEANYQLGELYYNGNGVKKSFPTAKSYYKKAADAGYADAQYMMGVMYRNGQGGEKDINEAKKWLQKAAEQGNSKAEKMLKQLN